MLCSILCLETRCVVFQEAVSIRPLGAFINAEKPVKKRLFEKAILYFWLEIEMSHVLSDRFLCFLFNINTYYNRVVAAARRR